MVANGRSALVMWRSSYSWYDLSDDFGIMPRNSSLCSMWRTTISLSRPCPWTMVCAGNLDPMYFLGSVNMDVPVVAKQSEVGISYSGSVPSPLVPKKHLNIPPILAPGGNVSCQKIHSCRGSAADKACDRSG